MKHREDISRLRNSSTAFRVGLVIALGFVWMAFNWTTDSHYENLKSNFDDEIVIEEDIPVTVHPKEKLPEPPKVMAPKIIIPEVEPVAIVQKTTEPVLIERELLVPENVKITKKEKTTPPPKVVEIIDEPEDDEPEIFISVAEMPRFVHNPCEKKKKGEDLYKCAEKAMLEYVYANIRYPVIARDNGIEGKAVIYFVIDETGEVTLSKVLRDPGGGIGKEALRVVNKMPDWLPGKQRHRPVKVQFTLPIDFQLED
ncbi:MAG: TonB family protein [Bacteroidota bacterium]